MTEVDVSSNRWELMELRVIGTTSGTNLDYFTSDTTSTTQDASVVGE